MIHEEEGFPSELFMWVVLILVLLALNACSTTPTATDQKPKDVVTIAGPEAQVAIREKCRVTLPAEPAWQVDVTAMDADNLTKSKALLVELEQRRDYENRVKAAATECQ